MADTDACRADVAERLPQPLRDHDGSMTSSGAADGDRQIALALGDVVRNHEAHVRIQAIHELPGRRIAFEKIGDRLVAAGAAAQRGNEVRVRQAADVEHQIGVHRNPVLEPETEKRDYEARASTLPGESHEEMAQLVNRHVRRVDDFVGQRPDQIQPLTLVPDPLGHRPIRRQRMRAPRFAEPPDERRVARFQKNQDWVQPRHLPKLLEDLRKRRQEAALAHVDDDGDFLDVSAGTLRQLRERRDERGRQVVDAEVAEIFQRADRLRLSRTGQPGQHDERRSGARRALALAAGFWPRTLRRLTPCRRLGAAQREPPDSISSSSSSGVGVDCSRSAASSRLASSRAA